MFTNINYKNEQAIRGKSAHRILMFLMSDIQRTQVHNQFRPKQFEYFYVINLTNI